MDQDEPGNRNHRPIEGHSHGIGGSSVRYAVDDPIGVWASGGCEGGSGSWQSGGTERSHVRRWRLRCDETGGRLHLATNGGSGDESLAGCLQSLVACDKSSTSREGTEAHTAGPIDYFPAAVGSFCY